MNRTIIPPDPPEYGNTPKQFVCTDKVCIPVLRRQILLWLAIDYFCDFCGEQIEDPEKARITISHPRIFHVECADSDEPILADFMLGTVL